METENTTRKNPSRETCQKIIKRILVTEVLEKGCNEHFRRILWDISSPFTLLPMR